MKPRIQQIHVFNFIAVCALVALPSLVSAQQAGTNPSISGTVSGATAACTSIVNSTQAGTANGVLASIAVFLSGVPFRIGAFIGIVVAAITLMLDSGHLSHIVQRILQILVVIVMIGLIAGFIFGSSTSLVQC